MELAIPPRRRAANPTTTEVRPTLLHDLVVAVVAGKQGVITPSVHGCLNGMMDFGRRESKQTPPPLQDGSRAAFGLAGWCAGFY